MDPSTVEPNLKALQRLALDPNLPVLDKIRPPLTMPGIMGVGRDELAHSRLLAALLDSERHKHAEHLLRSLLQDVAEGAKAQQSGEALKRLATEPWERISVRRELLRIDLVIEIHLSLGPAVIGIENKIDAGEQEHQLSRYQQALQTYFPSHEAFLLFLTLDERAAKTADPHSSVPVISIGYGTVTRALDRTLLLGSLTDGERILLEGASHHIKEELVTNSETERMIQKLWTEHPHALQLAILHRPIIENARDRYLQRLREALGDDMEIERYPKHGEQREIKLRLKSWIAAGFPFTFMFCSRSGVPHVCVLLERDELKNYGTALRSWAAKTNAAGLPIVDEVFSTVPGWTHWGRVLLDGSVQLSGESFDESTGAKDDRTGKSDVLRTWNPEPGVPVEMS